MWRNQDPREFINKRADILILRPGATGSSYRVGQGQVETKNAWSIWTSFDDHKHIDEWDPLWWWDWSRFPGAVVSDSGDTVEGVHADDFVETLFTIVSPSWSLRQETDRLGFKTGVALIDSQGRKIAVFEQEAYEELIRI